MKQRELQRYLGSGKLRFAEQNCSNHLHYAPMCNGSEIILPTIIAVSYGAGEVPRKALKGVAESLGLQLEELLTSEACRIRRECVLLMLSWKLLCLGVRMQNETRNPELGERRLKAMIVSVEALVCQAKTKHKGAWNQEEAKVFKRAIEESQNYRPSPLDNPLTQTVATSLLKVMGQN